MAAATLRRCTGMYLGAEGVSKLLSICVAAYNVSDYLRACVESCVIEGMLSDYDVVIVNDGSTDETSSIAHMYEARYPGFVKVIDKENGGYGSAVEAALRAATGKYVKLLDGDDEFDSDGLRLLLRSLQETDSDWVVTDYIQLSPDNEKLVKCAPFAHEITETSDQETIAGFLPSMWCSAFKREVFERHPFALPHNCLYTDTLFVARFLPYVSTATYLPHVVYRYQLGGRDEQSNTKANRARHVNDEIEVWRSVLLFALSLGENNLSLVMIRRIKMNYWNAYSALLLLQDKDEALEQLKVLEAQLKEQSAFLYEQTNGIRTIRLMRMTKGMAYSLIKIRRQFRY